MKRINSMVWGIVLLLAGVVLTLSQLRVIDISGNMTVPVILLGLSVVFHLYYFLSRVGNEGLLVPGGILLVYGFLFLAIELWPVSMGMLWPLFILGPAVGLFELYAFSGGKKGSMVPVFILTAIGGGLLLYNMDIASFGVIAAIILIGIGVALMITAFIRSPRDHGNSTYTPPVVEVKVETENKSTDEQK